MDDVELELGQATIVYEDPEDGVIRKTVPNEHVAYFQDHWIFKRNNDDDADTDLVRRVPARRVYYVERSVEEFEEEVATRIDQIQSFVEELQTRIPIGGGGSRDTAESILPGGSTSESGSEERSERIEIDLTDDEADGGDDTDSGNDDIDGDQG